MAVVMVEDFDPVEIPNGIDDLASFLEWVHSADLPEKLPIHYINGEVWVDFSMEEADTHNLLKGVIHRLLGALVEQGELGEFFQDGMRLTNETAGFSCEPDGMFISQATLDCGGVVFRAGKRRRGKKTEAVGTPDLVLEIVSPNSEDKDTDWLFPNYWNAGIPEYWLVDDRGDELRFDIYKHGSKGYVATRKVDGWMKSPTFEKAFRLIPRPVRNNLAHYKLEVR